MLVVIHGDGAVSWVDGNYLFFKCKIKTADCHDDINTERYIE